LQEEQLAMHKSMTLGVSLGKGGAGWVERHANRSRTTAKIVMPSERWKTSIRVCSGPVGRDIITHATGRIMRINNTVSQCSA
jgi:hypothetical protein